MKSYWALVFFLVKGKEGRFENSLDIEFQAVDPKQAIKDAVRFARNREKNLGDWEFVCLKIGEFSPAPIEADGSFVQAHLPWFFEWKYDWPGTLEERIEAFA